MENMIKTTCSSCNNNEWSVGHSSSCPTTNKTSQNSKLVTKVDYDCTARLRREMRCRMLNFTEHNPTKFATTSWMRSQVPYLAYRAVTFIHAISVLLWKAYVETQKSETHWITMLSTWTFILYCIYHFLALLLTLLQYFHDCLCNDDLSWYHKLCWLLQTIVFNGSVSCFIGFLIHSFGNASGNQSVKDWTSVFTSNDINFNVISGTVMIIDIMVTNITIRLLHVIYVMIFYMLFFVFHVYRWAAGYTPVYVVLDYGTYPQIAISFIPYVLFLLCPFVHLLAYGLDNLRWKLLVNCIGRYRRRYIRMANVAEGIMTFMDEESRLKGIISKTPYSYDNKLVARLHLTP